jgi:glucose-1-phosphate thymidylyltransferase
MKRPMEIVGLVPAAGRATRLSPLPFSKELFPVSLEQAHADSEPQPKLVSHYLFNKLRFGGAQNVYIVIRDGKWDIPGYFGSGSRIGLNLAYHVVDETPSVPFTVDSAYPFIKDAMVLFGYPDILFRPHDAFTQLVARLLYMNADVVIGVFDLFPGQLTDRVEIGKDGNIDAINVRSTSPDSSPGWIIAAWTPIFTNFLHQHLKKRLRNHSRIQQLPEMFLGHVFQTAINEGIKFNSVRFRDHNFWDIGTPKGLQKALGEKDRWI